MICPLCSEGSYGIDESSSEHDEICTQCQRSCDVQSRADAAVEEDARPASDLTHDRRQQIDRRRHSIQLTRPMIRDLNAVNTCLQGALRIGRMQNSLQYQSSVPLVSNFLEIIP